MTAILLGTTWFLPACTAPIQPDPVYRETEVRQSRPRLNGEVFDPQESDVVLKEKLEAADRKAERIVGNVERNSEFVQHFWIAKKRILQDQFGIDWKTPAELNPSIEYESYGQAAITDAEERVLRSLTASRLSGSSEEVRGLTRSFEGIASVWTRDTKTEQIKEYRFAGHDESWAFVEVHEWEEWAMPRPTNCCRRRAKTHAPEQ